MTKHNKRFLCFPINWVKIPVGAERRRVGDEQRGSCSDEDTSQEADYSVSTLRSCMWIVDKHSAPRAAASRGDIWTHFAAECWHGWELIRKSIFSHVQRPSASKSLFTFSPGEKSRERKRPRKTEYLLCPPPHPEQDKLIVLFLAVGSHCNIML